MTLTNEELQAELTKAWKAIDTLWGELTADSVKFLRESNAEVVNLCKRVHMKLWHPDEEE